MTAGAGAHFELTSDPQCLAAVRDRLQDWARAQGWHDEQLGELVLALDEALANVMRHGYQGRPGQPIEVDVAALHDTADGEGLELRVRDYGRQVDPATIRGRDLAEVRPGGLGVHIIRAMTNFVEYQCAPSGGMLLVLRKFKGLAAGVPERPTESA